MNTVFRLFSLVLLASLPKGYAMDNLKLSSGYNIPSVGLGTSSIKPYDLENAIINALENGYKHIDTAFTYHNEEAIGKVLKKWFAKGGARENLFITSKLPSQGNRPESVEKYLKQSLKDLGLDYVDMYLIHTPFGLKEGVNNSPKEVNGIEIFENVNHNALWKEMEKQVKNGYAKSIGLSNFNQSQIDNVYKNAEIKPSNLQVEIHAYLPQKQLRQFCKKHNIVVTAYAPLGSHNSRTYLHKSTGKDLPALIDLPIIKDLAQKYKKSPSQILLRHTVQDDLVVIPKSSNSDRQKLNIDLFDFKLTAEDVKKIDNLDKGEKGRVFDFLKFYKGIPHY
ncbi:PREDICTED: alcohol dehydrogenase [NADP(+)]-like isoform X2 [Ceratosolen solmsi marchali]|uniref:Alcohol dehydrogenase [NADP(+)]-like isoform X2 n=1 Tax=Ceratosolen solmsi marchali TaxID=326594 RepID=A0AAJ6YDQ3_9HYME|nr:PREDICTED: alcohol dehydrogenase [NADP(+)]-like isoform X2 [Ceratosolen solmsi marchali]